MKKLLIVLFICLATSAVLAQDNPTVEIVLSQSTAQQGDIITADVYVRNAVNVAGIDIGITVDNICLRINDRQPGDYLPTTSEEGAFSPFSELNDHDTRFAAALTDRSKNASGDGVFYRVELEVTCETGTARLDFSYAKLSTYADPTAESVSLISYELGDGTLNAINTQLTIVPAGQVTIVAPLTATPTTLVDATPTTLVDATPTTLVDATPTTLVDATPVSALSVCESQKQRLLMVIAVLAGLIIILLAIVALLVSRHPRSQT